MEAIRQIVRIPSNHEVKIKVPEHISEDELMEVILLVKKRKRSFKDKIKDLKKAVKDPMYLEDMKSVNQDFEYVDLERGIKSQVKHLEEIKDCICFQLGINYSV